VALAEESIRASETHVSAARAAFYPNVDGAVEERSQTINLKTFGFNFDFPLLGFSLPGIVGPFSVFDARATANTTVLDFTTIRKYQASRSGLQAAKADLSVTKDQVSEQVARAYLASLREDAAYEAARANVDLSEALLRLAQSQKDAGTGTGIEVTRAQVQLANDNQRLTVAENNRRRAILQLLRAMGLTLTTDVQLTDKLSYETVDTAAIEALLETARKGRSDLKAQEQHQPLPLRCRDGAGRVLEGEDGRKVQPLVSQRPISDWGEFPEGLRPDALSERVPGALACGTRSKDLDRRLEIVRVGRDLGVQEGEPQARAKLGIFGSDPGGDRREHVVHGRQDDGDDVPRRGRAHGTSVGRHSDRAATKVAGTVQAFGHTTAERCRCPWRRRHRASMQTTPACIG